MITSMNTGLFATSQALAAGRRPYQTEVKGDGSHRMVGQ